MPNRTDPVTGFQDHFSHVAEAYSASRPRYQSALFAALASCVPARDHAWDCATGNGQAAVELAEHFDEVVATDGSDSQLDHAIPHPRVRYASALAASSGLPEGWASLITVAQALHWFDLPAFYDEVRRVLRPGGVLAAWCYNLMQIEPEIDARILAFYRDTVGPYWPEERRFVEAGYRDLDFPFDEIDLPAYDMEAVWTLEDVGRYLRTWSATARYRQARDRDPVAPLMEELATHWGPPKTGRRVRWPIRMRAGTAPR